MWSGRVALQTPGRLASPHAFLVHGDGKPICSITSHRICTLPVFHAFLESPRKCSGAPKEQVYHRIVFLKISAWGPRVSKPQWLLAEWKSLHWTLRNLQVEHTSQFLKISAHIKLENLWYSGKNVSLGDRPEVRSQRLYHFNIPVLQVSIN